MNESQLRVDLVVWSSEAFSQNGEKTHESNMEEKNEENGRCPQWKLRWMTLLMVKDVICWDE